MEWPSWWEWHLALSSHVRKRMEGRGFNEVDLRDMLERARGYRENVVEGRWTITTSHQGESWEVVVEPEPEDQRLVVVTAYAID